MKVTRNTILFNTFFLLSLFFSTSTSAQLHMKLQWMPQDSVWGVFVKADTTVQPSQNILLGSGQVTIVAPSGFGIENMTSYMGSWVQNARANSPKENEAMDYISFGIRISEPITELGEYDEALILTFSATNLDCPSSLSLIENEDPFAQSPNSLNTNPGNDLQMVDLGNERAIYQYVANYELEAWNCNSTDDNISTSVEDFVREKIVKVFPNPFNEQLVFEMVEKRSNGNLQIQLYDNLGRLMHSELMIDTRLKIEVGERTALYFYQIIDLNTNELLDSGKLIKR